MKEICIAVGACSGFPGAALNAFVKFDPGYKPFGDGRSAEKIVEYIRLFLN